MAYIELQVTTNFTFLRGGSHPEEMVERALELGYAAIAITDRNTLAGIVRAYSQARNKNIRVIPGCRLDLHDGTSLLAYPTNKDAYARLSLLLSTGNLRTEKGKCLLYKKDVYAHAEGLLFIAIAPYELNEQFDFDSTFINDLKEYKEHLGPQLYLSMTRGYQSHELKKMHRLAQWGATLGIPLVATNDVHYHASHRRELQDVLTCIREKCTIFTAGYRLHQNAERYLKPQEEIERLFRAYPQAVANTLALAARCAFCLSELQYIYPQEITSPGYTPQQELVRLTMQGAHERFGATIPPNIQRAIDFELDFIAKRDYAAYFLTVYDLVRFARSRGILCQGRGSAANSTVCYCLGITSVDPSKFKLLFARFMSDARNEPPDIDVDFEHERREEVIQYIYEKYGRHRSAIVATVTQVQKRGAIRDVAKAMGYSMDMINLLSKTVRSEWFDSKLPVMEGIDLTDPHLRKTMDIINQYIGFPRQLGQHTGGFVITQGAITDLCPLLNARMENRTNIEWNKDDIEVLGFLKIDVLALGMLTCIRKAFDLVKLHYGPELTLANVPQDDAQVYDMISRADTIGVFQIESRAQMSMLPRLKPRQFYDLVIEVAIVRPGPIQGEMVHPYLRRRNGQEPVDYPSEELKTILGRTLGVPLFQEQAMEIAIVAAGFTPGEADNLRRSMASFKANGKLHIYEDKLVSGMMARGYDEAFARRVFSQLKGFEGYGFPESHAVSFALLVYVSCWLKHYYPDVFCAALLNSQPMGFYHPAQLIRDAQNHQVAVLPVDVNFSQWDNTLVNQGERYHAIQLGFRQVKGLRDDEVALLLSARAQRHRFATINQVLDAGLCLASLEILADADAFTSLGIDRREALWQVLALKDNPEGLFAGQPSATTYEPDPQLPTMTLGEHVVQDYASTTFSLKAHPVSFLRGELGKQRVTAARGLASLRNGAWLRVAGLVLVRQRPGTASGTCFVTIEDETGTVNLVIFPAFFDKYRKEILNARLLMVEGRLQVESGVTHVIVKRCADQSHLLKTLTSMGNEGHVSTLSRADESDGRAPDHGRAKPKGTQLEMFPGGRNFR